MALKADREVVLTDITNTCESVAEPGMCLVYATTGSGVAIGDSRGKCDLVNSPSGYVPAGILLNHVVNVDQTRYHRNFHRDETMVSEPCNVMRRGWVVTDQITGTPTNGGTAYLSTSGVFTPTVSATGGTAATPKVGQFRSIKDENGFVKVEVNLPVV